MSSPRITNLRKSQRRIMRPRSQNGFDYPTQLVGTSTWKGSDGNPVSVYYDPSGGTSLQALAQDILTNRITGIMESCDAVFGVRGKAGNVIIVSGNSGAYHYDCAFDADSPGGSDWYEDDMGSQPNPASSAGGIVAGLVMAEVCESYMGLQKKGWNCGGSGGEALSRILAEDASGGISGAMQPFSARSSYDGSDWISKDQGSDQDYPSIACGMLYLDWMRSLGFTIGQIIAAGEPDGTLASNYTALTGKPKSQAFPEFKNAVSRVNIQATNPFGIKDDPYPFGSSPPPPPPPPMNNLLHLDTALPAGTYNLGGIATLFLPADVKAGDYPLTASASGSGAIQLGSPVVLGTVLNVAGGTLTFPQDLAAGSYPFTLAQAHGALPIPWRLLVQMLITLLQSILPILPVKETPKSSEQMD